MLKVKINFIFILFLWGKEIKLVGTKFWTCQLKLEKTTWKINRWRLNEKLMPCGFWSECSLQNFIVCKNYSNGVFIRVKYWNRVSVEQLIRKYEKYDECLDISLSSCGTRDKTHLINSPIVDNLESNMN